MMSSKDWSCFMFDVGGENYKPNTKRLEWYVFNHDHNSHQIVPVNVFHHSLYFMEGLIEAKKKYGKDFKQFSTRVRDILRYSYWSKCEYETVITSLLPYIDKKEFLRIKEEYDKRISEGKEFYREDVHLTVGYKIDVYTQVMMNWDKFIEYVWNNKRLITREKIFGE